MAKRRMISKSLGASRKVREVVEIDNNLTDFALLLYCLGIAHHDDLGQISADPHDWRYHVFSTSKHKKEDFVKALLYLESVDLLRLSQCKKVYLYVNFQDHQTLKNDRNPQIDFPGIQWNPVTSSRARPEVKLREEEVKLREEKTLKDKILENETICIYCGINQKNCDIGFEIDHFVPRSAGGLNIPDNLKMACRTCNKIKGSNIFNTIKEARNYIHKTLWLKNRKRYEIPRKNCFKGIPPQEYQEIIVEKEEIKQIFNYWNSLYGLTSHRKIDDFITTIKARLKDYSLNEITEAFRNYAKILNSADHWYSNKMALSAFLTRKNNYIDIFITKNDPFKTYLTKKGGNRNTRKPTEEEIIENAKLWTAEGD